MERIPFYKKFIISIAKIDQYPKLVKEGLGRAFLYLLLFTLIFGTIQGFLVGSEVYQGMKVLVDEFEKGVPDFFLIDGKLRIDEEMPIVLEETPDALYIIDLNGEVDPEILDDYLTGALILEDRVIFKKSTFETTVYDFQDFQGLELSKEDVSNFLPLLKSLGPIVGVLTFIVFFVGKAISGLFLSLVGLIIAAIKKTKLSFGALYSIGIYSLTLTAIFDVLFPQIFKANFPWFFYYLIAIVYVWLAISMQSKQIEE